MSRTGPYVLALFININIGGNNILLMHELVGMLEVLGLSNVFSVDRQAKVPLPLGFKGYLYDEMASNQHRSLTSSKLISQLSPNYLGNIALV